MLVTPRNSNCQLEQDWRLQCPKRYGEILSSVGSRAQHRDPGERVRLDRGNRIASDGLLGAAVGGVAGGRVPGLSQVPCPAFALTIVGQFVWDSDSVRLIRIHGGANLLAPPLPDVPAG